MFEVECLLRYQRLRFARQWLKLLHDILLELVLDVDITKIKINPDVEENPWIPKKVTVLGGCIFRYAVGQPVLV